MFNSENSQISSGTNSELYRLLAMHQKQIEDTQTGIEEIKACLSDIRTDLAVIPEKLNSSTDRLKESVNSLGARLGSVEERLAILESQTVLLSRDTSLVLQAKESWDKVSVGIIATVIGAILITVFVNNNPYFHKPSTNKTEDKSGTITK